MRLVRVPGSVELKVSAASGAGKWRWASFGRTGTQNLQTSRVCGARDADQLRFGVFDSLLCRSLDLAVAGFSSGALPPPATQGKPQSPLCRPSRPLSLPLFDASDSFTECLLRHLVPMPPFVGPGPGRTDWARPVG